MKSKKKKAATGLKQAQGSWATKIESGPLIWSFDHMVNQRWSSDLRLDGLNLRVHG